MIILTTDYEYTYAVALEPPYDARAVANFLLDDLSFS